MAAMSGSEGSGAHLRRVRGKVAGMLPGEKLKVWDHYLSRSGSGRLMVDADPGTVYGSRSLYGNALVERTATGWDVTLFSGCGRISGPPSPYKEWVSVDREYAWRLPGAFSRLAGRRLTASARVLCEE